MCKGHGSRSFVDHRMCGGISSRRGWRHISACSAGGGVVVSTMRLGLLANGPCEEIGRVFKMHQIRSGIPAFMMLIVMIHHVVVHGHAIMAVKGVILLVCYQVVVGVIARFVKSHGFAADGA